MMASLEELRKKALKDIEASESLEKLNELRVSFLGKKGEFTSLLKGLKDLPPEERPKMGQLVNEAKAEIEKHIETVRGRLEEAGLNARLSAEKIDVSLPGKRKPLGHPHPNARVLDEVEEIFIGMGYTVASGPEIEKDYYNFEALNIPADHPAKDEQDTFYINGDILLRTQTSPCQVREME
ncbi:MAG: phenylalanine--tRNA ligase subunit alpha, partial [Lachnospiraceae bacterium]|nr:phenylalanine--tRNA ligase subunit alpha [Lachnospiraceae bacterium]